MAQKCEYPCCMDLGFFFDMLGWLAEKPGNDRTGFQNRTLTGDMEWNGACGVVFTGLLHGKRMHDVASGGVFLQ